MKLVFVLFSLLLILSMGCIGGSSSANAQGSLNDINDSDFAITDPGFEDDNVTPVDFSAQ